VQPTTFRDRLTDTTGALVKAPLIAALALVPYAIISQSAEWTTLGKMFLITSLISWAMIAGNIGAQFRATDSWARRFRLGALGLAVGALAFWFDGWNMPRMDEAAPDTGTTLFGVVHFSEGTLQTGIKYLLYFGGVMAVGRWWRTAAKDRKERFSLFPPIAAAFWGSALMFLWPWTSGGLVANGIVPLVLATVAVQASSPWVAPPPPPSKKLRFRHA